MSNLEGFPEATVKFSFVPKSEATEQGHLISSPEIEEALSELNGFEITFIGYHPSEIDDRIIEQILKCFE